MANRDYEKSSRIRASDELLDALHEIERRQESHEDAIWRLLDQQEALQKLVQEWREFAEPNGWDEYSDGIRDASVSCADELQDVLEREP